MLARHQKAQLPLARYPEDGNKYIRKLSRNMMLYLRGGERLFAIDAKEMVKGQAINLGIGVGVGSE